MTAKIQLRSYVWVIIMAKEEAVDVITSMEVNSDDALTKLKMLFESDNETRGCNRLSTTTHGQRSGRMAGQRRREAMPRQNPNPRNFRNHTDWLA
jgi:hypothetical protein